MNGLPPISPYSAGLRGRCPRCGKGRLFNGYLTPARRCESCQLDFSFADSGDGPAVFVILIAGFIVVFAAMLVEILWLPLILLTTLGLLRPAKGLMIALQYHHEAEEGRLDRSGE